MGSFDRRLLPADTDPVEYLLSLPPEERLDGLARMGSAELEALDGAWRSWAHEGQIEPACGPDGSDWSTWVVMGGRGFGKTMAGSSWIAEKVAEADGPLRIALVGATLAEARRVMIEGESGLLRVAGPWIREWRPSLGILKFRTGAEAALFSGHSPELLRGPEHHLAWCDELAKWEKPGETWDMLQLGLRLGTRPRALVTTTPRPGPHLRRIMAAPGCVVTGGPTRANPHLSPVWQESVHALYAGTRLARQELEGELLSDAPGALWTEALLERCRAKPDESNIFVRAVIAVDPPAADGTCGIIACAKDGEGRAHVLADHSVTARTPEGWARAVADAARIWSLAPPRNGEGGGGGPAPPAPPEARIWVMCPRAGTYVLKRRDPPDPPPAAPAPSIPVTIVAEQNQGGRMVESVLRTADPSLRVKRVTAHVGKAERAAPVAMLFETGRVVLHGRFPELEAELCGMIAGGDYEGLGTSPDRADAMVWGLTELMLQKERAEPRIRAL